MGWCAPSCALIAEKTEARRVGGGCAQVASLVNRRTARVLPRVVSEVGALALDHSILGMLNRGKERRWPVRHKLAALIPILNS